MPYSFQLTSEDFFIEYSKKSEATDIFNQHIQLESEISFAHIDGNHAYPFVKNDFENVNKYLKKDGLILFDDSMGGMKFGSAYS